MTTSTEAPQLLSLDQVAASLGISRQGVYRAIHRGDLIAVKIGARRLIRPTDLAAFVESLDSGAGAPATPGTA
jgi:excisionase family DNA binding protein